MDADGQSQTGTADEAPLNPDEIAPLLDNLDGPDASLRTASLSAFGTLPLSTDAWLAISNRLEPLLRAVTNPDPALLEAAVLVPTRRIRGILHTLVGKVTDPAGRRDLVRALARARDRAAIPPLLEAFRGDDDAARRWAAEYLSFFDVPEARDEFARVAASDPYVETQFWSAICLAQLDEPAALARFLAPVEPESLAPEPASSDFDSSLTFMWGDPMVAFARIQGRGPWPAVTQSMLEHLAELDDRSRIRVMIEALLSGYGEPDAVVVPPEPEPPEPAQDPVLVEQAHQVRDHLERTFPQEPPGDLEILAYLPKEERVSLVSTLWTNLADLSSAQQAALEPVASAVDPWTLVMGGNALVEMVHTMGSSFTPEIEPLFRCFARAQDNWQLSDQIGWTAGRAGVRRVVLGLRVPLGSDDVAMRLAATRMIEAASGRVGDSWPPMYGGAPAPPAPRQISFFVDETIPPSGDRAATKPDMDKSTYSETMLHEWGHWFGPASFTVGGSGTSGSEPPAETTGADEENGVPRCESFRPDFATANGGGDEPARDSMTDPPRTAYAHLKCPQVVTAGVEFALEVGIAAVQDPSISGPELERPSWSQGPYVLTVQVVAEGFTVKAGEVSRHELPVTVEKPYPFVVVHLAADMQSEEVVPRIIQVTYFVGSQPIGIAYRAVAVRKEAGVAVTLLEPVPLGAVVSVPGEGFTEPDLTVQISEGQADGDLLWTFETPRYSGVAVPTEPIRTNIGENPAEFARQLISRMNQSAGRALSLQMRGIGRTVAQATPKELWEVLGSVAADVENRAPTLLIISQDPYVPWELALLKTPIDTGSAPFLGAQTVLGRWILPPVGNDTPNPPVQEPRSIGSMRILSGVYLKERGRWRRLEHAEQEAADLASRYHGVPVVAEMPSVVDFLENPPAAEVFHFAGHAIYDPSSLENGLVLSDETYLDSTLISGAQFFPKPRPFVFLNACQAGSGYEVLGGYSGLVGALLTAGASAVVAPLWSVNDEAARQLSLDFYARAVDDDVPPAEILRRWRARFGKDEHGNNVVPDSPVHLAYQFFGHPSMRLVRERS